MNQSKSAAGTRDRLVAAAWSVVRDEGLRAASSRRITEAAGANLGAITYHFGSKDALVGLACAAQLHAWLAPLADALLEDEGEGGNQTDVAISSLFDAFGARRDDIHALLEVAVIGRDLPGVADAIRDELARFHDLIAALLTRLRDRGDIPTTVDPPAMAGMFTSFALGLMMHDTLGTAPADILAITGQLLALLTPPR